MSILSGLFCGAAEYERQRQAAMEKLARQQYEALKRHAETADLSQSLNGKIINAVKTGNGEWAA